MQATRPNDITPASVPLCVAFELSEASWKLAMHDGKRNAAAIVTVRAEQAQARLDEALRAIDACKHEWGLHADTPVVAIYEVGQDGFWIARALEKRGMEVKVIAPAGLPVARQAGRARTDRIDAIRLVNRLRAWLRGERGTMRVVPVPSEQDEAREHLVHARDDLQKEIARHQGRMRTLLRSVDCRDAIGSDFARQLAQGQVRCHDGRALPAELQLQLQRECERLERVRPDWLRRGRGGLRSEQWCSRGFAKPASRLRNGLRLHAQTRPARVTTSRTGVL